LENSGFSPHPFHRIAQLMPQMWEVKAAYIAQLDPFELLPQALARIQLWGISRQALQLEAVGRALGQEFLDHLTAMNRGAIPGKHHPPSPTKGSLPIKTIGEACRQQTQALMQALILYAHERLQLGQRAEDLFGYLFAKQQRVMARC
jgi:hypothetical protein